jgi:hypothetical protein
MRKLGVTSLTGKSGKQYEFNDYPGDMRFNDFIPGVYFISKQVNNESTAIFLGESDNVDVTLQSHDSQPCFDENDYNRVSFYKNASREVRESIIKDLLPTLDLACG